MVDTISVISSHSLAKLTLPRLLEDVAVKLIGVGFYLGQKPELTLPHNKEIIVYPDQIK